MLKMPRKWDSPAACPVIYNFVFFLRAALIIAGAAVEIIVINILLTYKYRFLILLSPENKFLSSQRLARAV